MVELRAHTHRLAATRAMHLRKRLDGGNVKQSPATRAGVKERRALFSFGGHGVFGMGELEVEPLYFD